MQAIGTVANHTYASLSDEQARRLEGQARQYYLRVLALINQTGCSIRDAIAAVAEADEVTR
jgi:hypothetical protein